MSYQQALRPLGVVFHRIRRDCANGRPLFGLKFDTNFTEQNDKADSLPRLQMVDHGWSNEHGGGASNTPNGINSILRDRSEFVLQLITDNKNGWITEESVEAFRKMGALNVANLLMDCIEQNDDGETDLSLDGTLDAPIMFSCKETAVLMLGVGQDITVTFLGHRYVRARRAAHVITS